LKCGKCSRATWQNVDKEKRKPAFNEIAYCLNYYYLSIKNVNQGEKIICPEFIDDGVNNTL
jgi:hypothetical protein